MKQAILVAQKEYLSIIKKKSFLLSTLLLPIFIVVISMLSGYSSKAAEKKASELEQKAKTILIVDDAEIIDASQIKSPFELITDKNSGIEKVKSGDATALIYYPKDIVNSTTEIYGQNIDLFSNTQYTDIAKQLVKENVRNKLSETDIALLDANIKTDTKVYDKGAEVNIKIENFVIPLVAVALYFFLTSFGSGYLLQSVSQEKESRTMEIMVTSIKPKDFMFGKIVGLMGVILTQGVILLALGIASVIVFHTKLPIDIGAIHLEISQVILSLVYLILGFLILANVMIGVGASMPSQREAQGFSSIFIILSIFPIYLATWLIAEPNGVVARIVSYFPLTSGLVMLFRNAITSVPTIEIIISILAMLLYTYLSFVLAYKLFELGSLEYSNKVDFKKLLKK